MHALFILHDEESYISPFPALAASMAAALEERGCKVEFYHEDLYHYQRSLLTKHLNSHSYDLIYIPFSVGALPYRNVKKVADAIKASNASGLFCLGGDGPSPEPEYFMELTGADAVCMDENQETVAELLESLPNRKEMAGIKGLAWRDGDIFHRNPLRTPPEDLNNLPSISYNRFPMELYRLARYWGMASHEFSSCILSGREYPVNDNSHRHLVKESRLRSNDSIIEEIRRLQKDYAVSYICFQDELLMSSPERAELLCEDFLRHGLDIKWMTPGNLQQARPKLLALMKRSGCRYIRYKIESNDNSVLERLGSPLTTYQITSGIEATLESGIIAGLFTIFGNPGDTLLTLEKSVDFIRKYDHTGELQTIHPVTLYPGSALYYEAIDRGLIKDCEDFYKNKLRTSGIPAVNLTAIPDEELAPALLRADKKLLRDYLDKLGQAHGTLLQNVYMSKSPYFRGFRDR